MDHIQYIDGEILNTTVTDLQHIISLQKDSVVKHLINISTPLCAAAFYSDTKHWISFWLTALTLIIVALIMSLLCYALLRARNMIMQNFLLNYHHTCKPKHQIVYPADPFPGSFTLMKLPGVYPLEVAAIHADVNMMKLLLEHQCHYDDSCMSKNSARPHEKPFWICCCRGQSSQVDVILSLCGVSQ